MLFMDYDSVKFKDYVKSFCIIPRVRNGAAEFTLLVQLVNNERTEVYDDTYKDPCDLLHDLRNGWYLGRGMQEPAYYEAVRDLTAYVDGLADAGLNVARIDR
jgi:hypothetical protein